MSDSTVKLGYYKPPEWERFVRMAEEYFPDRRAAVPIFFEISWRQFQQTLETEEVLDRLLEEVGVDSRESDEKKKILTRDSEHTGKQIWNQVGATIKDEIKRFASEHDAAGWEVVRAVVCFKLDGGMDALLAKKAERLEEELTEESEEQSKSLVERKTDAIIDEIGDGFTDDDLEEAIIEIAGHSDPTIRKYREKVLEERLDVKTLRRENKSDLYHLRDTWLEIITGKVIGALGGDCTKDECEPFTREEYGRALGSVGIDNSKSNKEEINEIAEHLIDRLSFVFDEESGEYVPAEEAPDEPEPEPEPEPEETKESMGESEPSKEELVAEADEEFDALMGAQPVATDGGQEVTQNDE